MKNVPEKIFLNLGQMSEGEWEEVNDRDFDQISNEWEITWCKDKIDSHDIEYVRRDIALDKNKWHRYKDDPPKEDGMLAVVFFGACFEIKISFRVADGSCHFDTTYDGHKPLAWMPLPDLSDDVRIKIMEDMDNG